MIDEKQLETKIRHFKTDYPNEEYPSFYSLSEKETAKIRLELRSLLRLKSSESDLDLVKRIREKATEITTINAANDGFNLLDVFKEFSIDQPEYVLIDWYDYNKIDRFRLEDVAKYFDDIWYKAADDIDIFDESLSWIISVDHDGFIWLLRLC